MKTKTHVWSGWSHLHHIWLKYNIHTLRCTNEEQLQYTAKQNIHIARHLCTLSRDKIIELLCDLTYCTTLFEYLQHTILAYDKWLHHCDVKTMIYRLLNTAQKRCSTVKYTVKVCYKHSYTLLSRQVMLRINGHSLIRNVTVFNRPLFQLQPIIFNQ